MKYCICFFSSLLLLGGLSAQTPLDRVDSIYQLARSERGDSQALEALNQALIEIYSDYSDTAAYYAEKQVEIARKRGWQNYEAIGLLMKGVSLEFSGQLDSALVYFEAGRDLAKAIRDSTTQLAAHNSLARVYSLKGSYQLAMEETLKAVELVIDQDNQERNLSILNSIGQRFLELNQPDMARGFLLDALRRNRARSDTQQLVSNCLNLGKTYLMLARPDSSRFFYVQALKLSNVQGHGFQRMRAYLGLTRYYLEQEQTDSAQWSNDRAKTLASRVKVQYRIHEAVLLQGKIHLQKEHNLQAISAFEKALAWFDSAHYEVMMLELLAGLSLAHERLGAYQQSLAYLRKLQELQADIYLNQRDLALAQVNVYREQRQEKETELLNQKIELSEQELTHQRNLRNLFFVLGFLVLVILLILINRYRYERRTKHLLSRKNQIIESEKQRSEKLLLNILPEEVAQELKDKGHADAQLIDQVTVLFTDFKGFTAMSEQLSPKDLVEDLHQCFSLFDKICEKYGIEKIKTIGDAYMAAGGLPTPNKTHPQDVAKASLEMARVVEAGKAKKIAAGLPYFEVRIGLHTGPVVAGIVGVKKFQYDIWGDTVNTASRMESHGEVGKVNISNDTYELLKNDKQFAFESRGKVEVKGKGEMEMHFVSEKFKEKSE